VNLNGWDTVSILDMQQVNTQLASRLGELVMDFQTSWADGFAGSYTASGKFGAWSITGGSGSDIYLTLPITSGTLAPQGAAPGKQTDISGMAVTVIVNLEWVPSAVSSQGKSLQFALQQVTTPGAARQPGGISVKSVTDPRGTGFGSQVGSGVANTLLDNKDKITFIFAQTGVVSTATATWLQPKESAYSFHQPQGGGQYLAILSVTSDRDISGLSSNIDSGIASSQYPLSFAVSGDLFLANVILPALPGAFPQSNLSDFAYANGAITLARQFNLSAVQAGAIWYTPTVTSLAITINANALKNATSGSVYLDLPNAYMDFSATTNNVLTYTPANEAFTFQKDPNPVTSTNDRVPWYDYILTLGAIGAAITAIVLAAVESGVSSSLTGSNLAGSLSTAPATSVKWQGLEQITVESGSLNDCFLLLANVA
jgi:hypothetical protein